MEKAKQYSMLPQVLLPWYGSNARDLPWRRDREPYHVWISEIMLQQTRVEAVRGYYSRFLAAMPDIGTLAAAEEETLLKLWEGLGYYSRARNLQKAARQIVAEWDGVFPEDYNSIRALPGVGPYTAGAIASICFDQKRAAVDGNVLRVLSRVTACADAVDLPAVKQKMTENLEAVYPDEAGMFTQAMMELGAMICTPRSPRCGDCPCRGFCEAAGQGTAARFPVRLPKREKKLEEKTVYLLQCGDRFAICRRPENGLLAGLWQFPNEQGTLEAGDALRRTSAKGLKPRELCRELHRNHIFTHIRWELTAYHILCTEESGDYTWATPEELTERYALPTAFRQFLPDILTADEQ